MTASIKWRFIPYITEKLGKKTSTLAVIETSSSPPVTAANFRESAIAEEPKEAIKEPIQVKAETTQYVDKHQVQQQPGYSWRRDQKDTNPQLGERWPNGGGYGKRGWMSGERFTCTYDLVEQMYYLYVRIVKAKDLPPSSITSSCDPYVEVKLGNYKGRTKHFEKKMNPEWNQVFAFSKERVQSSVLEVFVKDKEMVGRDDYLGRFGWEHKPMKLSRCMAFRCCFCSGEGVSSIRSKEQLVLTVEDQVHPSKDDVLGRISLPLNIFEKRLDHRPVHSSWFNLEKFGFGALEADRRKELKFSSRIHIRVCLEGGYHVLDESTMYISDQRPTARQLWKQPVGILEVGILGAQGLLPMKMKDGRGSTDAYVVARYGQKWVRTRTILDTFGPKWNEQYTWEVYDPCTVITLGVFDNCHLELRTWCRPCTRFSNWKGTNSIVNPRSSSYLYAFLPLLVLHPSGVKKMGELQLAVRFTSLSLANMIYLYGHPLLPKMHYLHPFTVNQVDNLRYQAMSIVAVRLGRAEPPLRKEVVEYMLDVDSHMWSMRRSKANFFRIMSLISGVISMSRWFGDVCHWKNPITSVLVHILFLILIWYPELILPTLFLYMFLIGLWNYRFRPRHPPQMDTKLSWQKRLRSVAGRIQTVVGDIGTQGERFHSLLGWRDPRATSLFIVFCLCAAVVLYMTPFRVVALVAGLYMLRHPRFRSKLPSVPSNFFKRLPARTDSLL
ncbi:C2 calcium/lipid-binding plant phosphoribosyltransferase family protein [Actinidia rufa]|uniref:C2 calcium/lipid-binding plant phosphoribosyltransferase family protein n=1 Tax=Actinidia rufa TaxID=165716 RepID=A0A7J0DVA7_9ERIC|nr:C2 calcium/lipid-binding plant phosphoribosyltransferase family protein [Actinidia rufa]